MGKIFCLMGKSSCGKDTIFIRLKEYFKIQLKPIIPYTTRPMRNGEEQGREYHFISNEQLEEYRTQGKIIEERVYETVKGLWHYATIDDGQIDLKHNNYIMITTLQAYNSLVNYLGRESVMPLYIEVEDGIRLERALKRERQQIEPNYNELCRRFIADNKDFSTSNLSKAQIEKHFINQDLQECINEIAETIEIALK